MRPGLIGGLAVALVAGALGVGVLLSDDGTPEDAAGVAASVAEDTTAGAPSLPSPAGPAGRDTPERLAGADAAPPAIDAAGATADAVAALAAEELREPVVLTGRVLDQAGRPVEGAQVTMSSEPSRGVLLAGARGAEPPERPETRTDREGRFRLDVTIETEAEEGLPFELFGAGHHLGVRHERFASLDHGLMGLAPPAWDVGDLYLEPGAWVSGRVVDASGRPVSGATVSARNDASEGGRRGGFGLMLMGGLGVALDEFVTGGDGRFTVRGLRPGTGSVTAVKPGLRLAVKEDVELLPLQAADVGDMVLEPGALIAGVVLDEQGAPIAGANVNVSSMARLVVNRLEDLPRQSLGQEFGQRSETDADGRFEIAGLGGGTYTVHVTADGFDVLSKEDVPAGTRDLRLSPARLGSLLLHVRGGGQPVDGALVAATPKSATRWFRTGERAPVLAGAEALAAAGREGDPSGNYLVQHAGLEGTELVLVAEGHARQAVTAPAVPSGEVVDFTVDLEPEARITGVVRADDGTPVARALVRLSQVVEPLTENLRGGFERDVIERRFSFGDEGDVTVTRRTTRTAADGSFALDGVGVGNWEISARAQGYVRGDPQPVIVSEAGPQAQVDLVLQPAGSVVGIVAKRDGTPVPGASVTIAPADAAPQAAASSGGGRAGRGPGGGPGGGRLLSAIGPGDGVPRADRRARTGADGRYRVDGLAPGDYVLRLQPDPLHGGGVGGGAFFITLADDEASGGAPDAFATVEPGEETRVDLVAPDVGSVSGRVMAGGRPAKDVTVTMRAAGALPFGGRTAQTDDLGHYAFADVAEGDYAVFARVPGAAMEERSEVSVAEGAARTVDLVFSGATLSGRVVQEGSDVGVAGLTITAGPATGGQPEDRPSIAFEVVTVDGGGGRGGGPRGMSMTLGGGDVETTRTDGEGRFELLYVKPGTYRIEAGGAGYVRASLDSVEVREGEDEDGLTIPVRRGAVVHGVVTDGKTGTRLDSVPVRLSGPSAREMTVTEDGSYRFEGLDTGDYTVSVLGSGFGSSSIASESVTLEVGEDRTLDLKTEG